MRITYKQRIFGYFLLIFILFAISIVWIEQKQEEKFRIANLEARLDGYAEMIHQFTDKNQPEQINRLLEILPGNIRVSIIDEEGKVLVDNDIEDVTHLDNHLDRPEIKNARYSNAGSNIRMSASMKQEYLYYARYYNDYYVRVALPYDTETRDSLKADKLFIYIILALFVIVLLLINYVAGRFGQSIVQLKNFVSSRKKGFILDDINFPEDELGEIGEELTTIFTEIEKSKYTLEIEREKLIHHFQYSEEGLCIYTPGMKKVYANTLFIQYLNFIADRPTFDVEELFSESIFQPIVDFIKDSSGSNNHLNHQINKNGKTFSVQAIIFEDKSFEVIIKDITKAERMRLLKQEMTSNIAHELRTPVTSLRGYLETVTNNKLDEKKQKLFIDRAYLQSVRLSNLIEDVSIISKIEEAPSQFSIEDIRLAQLIEELRIDISDKLTANRIHFHSSVKDTVMINGSYTLLYSIFRNLADNSISYGGQDIEIHIDNYTEDEKYYYFSYYDTGKGVEEKYLTRLFERFYRINEGRTRDTGGSGLGLSIVRNAILFHKGDIQVKNHTGGGLEFLFTLKKGKLFR